MICQVCNEKEATLKLVKVSVNKPLEGVDVCDECAVKVSPFRRKMHHSAAKKGDLAIKEVLQSLILQEKAGLTMIDGEDEPTCSECGIAFSTYRASYMLGCPACYDAFGEQLITDIRKIHGATRHRGDSPKPPRSQGEDPSPRKSKSPSRKKTEKVAKEEPTREEKLAFLHQNLQEAVAAEDFEQAALIRDQIRILEDEEKA